MHPVGVPKRPSVPVTGDVCGLGTPGIWPSAEREARSSDDRLAEVPSHWRWLRTSDSAGSDYLSLRYAHLAPDQRRVAVAKLNDYPVLALTLRLPWEGCRRCGAILLILWWKGRDSNPDPGIMSSDTPKACCQAQL